MKLITNIGFILLAVYLIIVGLLSLTGIAIPGILLGLLALAAGVFILIGK